MFVVETEAGTAALIIIGALLFVIAIIGRQIKEIGLAEGLFTLADLKEVLRNTQAPEDLLTLASAASTTAPEIGRDPEIRNLTHLAYEQLVAKSLMPIFGQGAVETAGPYDRPFDIAVNWMARRQASKPNSTDPTGIFPETAC
ncbi:hypothetical protein ACFYN3_42385 [Streptomyces lavendulae]|uniref:hypothetical protein n=1 Tax=Streptomyces lavendulae TaxID=1914 RepID=UPI00369DD55C